MKKTIRDIDLEGKRVSVRVCFNVPLDERGEIISDVGIRAILPTIKYLLERGGSIILCSRLDRPEGKNVDNLSLGVVVDHLSKMLSQPVQMVEDCIGPEVDKLADLVTEMLDIKHPYEKGVRARPGFEY
jgi:phosphoglycerate kinase